MLANGTGGLEKGKRVGGNEMRAPRVSAAMAKRRSNAPWEGGGQVGPVRTGMFREGRDMHGMW